MRRRLTIGLLTALAAGLVAVSSGLAAGTGPTLSDVGDVAFPDRSFVLSLPQPTELAPSQVTVLENGKPISGLLVLPASKADPRKFGVVLAIDTSNSMRGNPIVQALAAARAFAAHRNPNQQLAIVSFDNSPHVLLPFTRSKQAIVQTLQKIPAQAEGTRIYDGIAAAVELLQAQGIAAGTIVVLSDGADTGSDSTQPDVVDNARNAHVRVFTVGLRSAAFDAGPLQSLATSAGGSYTEAGRPEDLAKIFGKLGSQLSNEYLIRYRSLAGPNESVAVEIKVDGVEGAATAFYKSPPLPVKPAPAFTRSGGDKFLRSWTAIVLVALLCALLVGFAISSLLRPKTRSIRERMGEFVSVTTKRPRSAESSVTDRVLTGAERSLERTSWWPRFKEELEIANVSLSAMQITLGTILLTVAAGWVLDAFFGLWVWSLLALGVPFAVKALIDRQLRRQRALFAEQLPDNLDVLASALRAGHSMAGALAVVVNDAGEPSRTEFRRVGADEQLGVPLEDALGVVVHRMDSRELEYIALVAALQRETGGNTAEVLDRVTGTIRERFQLKRTIKTLTAQGRMARWIVSGLPVALVGIILLLNPHYLDPLTHRTIGVVMIILAVLMVITGSLVIRKIVNIRV